MENIDRNKRRLRYGGFTLIELSIVLVIIGLFVGGVLVGRDLIRSNELRAVIGEYREYAAAVTLFRDRYGFLPGDMPNATSQWGQATNCSPSHYGEVLAGGVCNGNGDGYVSLSSPSTQGGPGIVYGNIEQFGFWQQLGLAGLIKGTYSGQSDVGHFYRDGTIGWNLPESKLTNAGWCVVHSDANWVFDVDYRNSLTIGGTSGTLGACSNGVFFPREAQELDKKVDDGQPATGKIVAIPITRCTDAWTTINAFNASYSITGGFSTARNCLLAFLNPF